jgi:thiamine monophosphate synthase
VSAASSTTALIAALRVDPILPVIRAHAGGVAYLRSVLAAPDLEDQVSAIRASIAPTAA